MHPLVGRRRELGALTQGLDDAVSGRGNLWFVCGEPGIGKSRMLEEMAAAASDRDMHVFWARCWSSARAPALWPWIQVLRAIVRAEDASTIGDMLRARRTALEHVLPELGPDPGASITSGRLAAVVDAESDFVLFDAVAGLLTELGERRPVLVLLEDLHAADVATARLLEFLAGPIRGARVAVAGMYRNTEAKQAEVGRVLLPLAREVRPIHLTRLSREAVAEFLHHSVPRLFSRQLVDGVFAACHGNPLFLCEAARVATDIGADASKQVDDVLAAIERRVRELGATSGQAVAAKRMEFAQDGVLRITQDGESWLVERGDVVVRLGDTKGVRLLARLVAEPNREFHALDLAMEGRGPDSAESTTTGAILDDDARSQYRERIETLRSELAQAESWHDPARAERARTELAFVTRELNAAVGLGGRPRTGTTASERARVSVQRRIRDAIRRIEQHDADLGRQLIRAVRTGTYCSYSP